MGFRGRLVRGSGAQPVSAKPKHAGGACASRRRRLGLRPELRSPAEPANTVPFMALLYHKPARRCEQTVNPAKFKEILKIGGIDSGRRQRYNERPRHFPAI